MTPKDYAQAKDLFRRAIEVPELERHEFVRLHCNDVHVRGEVLSLLGFHSEVTILTSPPKVTETPSFAIEPPRQVDPYLVSRDVWEDNRQLLRRRLIVIAVVMSVLIVFSLFRLITYHYAAVGYGVRFTTLVISLGCAYVLNREKELTLTGLRIVEFVIMANAGLLAVLIFVRLMLETALREDAATLISVNHWNHFVWTMIILVYGIFLPNSWQRAASILIPIAAIPSVLPLILGWIDPMVTRLLAFDGFGMPLPAPFLGACLGIYAASLIHSTKVTAFAARRIAQYHVKRLIGEGGMGKVYEAEHLLLRRVCAVKMLRPELCADDQTLQRFEREVRATAQLTHPHTIEVYDFGQTKDDIFFFVMELLPGMNLRELVECSGPLPPARAVHFLIEVCEALEEAHGNGLIHRDIKPSNIFMSQRGGIYDFTKLLDFGVVREIKVEPRLGGTSHLSVGTPAYMAPEQITDPTGVDIRADIYGIGAVAYYLLTGRPPFLGESPLQVMVAQVEEAPGVPSLHQTGIPQDLEAIIMQCLAKRVDDRFSTAKMLKHALRGCVCAGTWTQADAIEWWQKVAFDQNPMVP